MGRLKELYGEADEERKKFPIELRVAGVSMVLHRPSSDERKEIVKRSSAYKADGDHDIWKRVMVLKYLCDEPNLREEDEVVLFQDVKDMEIPDQRDIDSAWDLMMGDIPGNLQEAVGHELFRQSKRTETG